MVDYACPVVRMETVAEGTAVVEVEQMEMVVAGREIPAGHKVGGMMNRSNYWEVRRTFEPVCILGSQPVVEVSKEACNEPRNHRSRLTPGL